MGGGFIGGEFFAASDSGEFLVQIEMPKDASLEQTNFMTQKAEAFLKKEELCSQSNYNYWSNQ